MMCGPSKLSCALSVLTGNVAMNDSSSDYPGWVSWRAMMEDMLGAESWVV